MAEYSRAQHPVCFYDLSCCDVFLERVERYVSPAATPNGSETRLGRLYRCDAVQGIRQVAGGVSSLPKSY